VRNPLPWVLLASALALPLEPADAGRKNRLPEPITSAAEVTQLGLYTFAPLSPELLQSRLAPGYTLKECIAGLGYSAFVMLTEQTLLDPPFLPVTSHSISLQTCATPPPGYAHPDPIGEFDWYVLYVASDVDEQTQALLAPYGAQRDVAVFTWLRVDDVNFSFTVERPGVGLLATGTMASPGVPVPIAGFECTPGWRQGRNLRPNPALQRTYAVDFVKREAVCAGTGSISFFSTSPFSELTNVGALQPLTLLVRVEEQLATYFTIPDAAK